MKTLLMKKIRIVLVETSHPGNIGAAARAMKTMGLSSLYLVRPKIFPHAEASAMAAGADDILSQAIVLDSLEQAIADSSLVLATSARLRAHPWPMLLPREVGEVVMNENHASIALIFGRESSGLTNLELQLAHYHVQIPSCDEFSSLNLAQAVQILCYEIRMAFLNRNELSFGLDQKTSLNYPKSEVIEDFYQHLEKTLMKIGFINQEKPMHQMQKLRCLFARARLDYSELQFLRGILTHLDQGYFK